MVYTTIDKLSNMMTEKSLPYFRVFDPTKEKIYDNDEVEVARVDSELDKLISYLEELEGTFVFVRLSKDTFRSKNKGGDTHTGTYQYRVNLRGSGSSKEGMGSTHGTYMSKKYEDLLEKFNALTLQSMMKTNDEKWEKRIAAIEEKNGQSPLEQYAPYFLPILSKISGVPAPAPIQEQPINGTEQAPPISVKSRLATAINRLMKVDKNFPDTLESLADFAESKPDAYNSYIPILKTMK